MKLNELEKLSAARVWGAEGVRVAKEALPDLLKELRAARAWLAAHWRYGAYVPITENAREAYRKLVEEQARD